jgi:hypothetical protein
MYAKVFWNIFITYWIYKKYSKWDSSCSVHNSQLCVTVPQIDWQVKIGTLLLIWQNALGLLILATLYMTLHWNIPASLQRISYKTILIINYYFLSETDFAEKWKIWHRTAGCVSQTAEQSASAQQRVCCYTQKYIGLYIPRVTRQDNRAAGLLRRC